MQLGITAQVDFDIEQMERGAFSRVDRATNFKRHVFGDWSAFGKDINPERTRLPLWHHFKPFVALSIKA